MSRVLYAIDDLTKLADQDARYAKVLEYIQELHFTMAKNGRTYLALIDTDTGLRLAAGADLAQLNAYLDSIPEEATLFEVNTKQ